MTDTATAHLSAASTAAVARNAGPVLDIKNLTIGLPKGADRPYAVEKLDLTVNRGEIVCIVGESGSGKSVMTSAIMNPVRPVEMEAVNAANFLMNHDANGGTWIKFARVLDAVKEGQAFAEAAQAQSAASGGRGGRRGGRRRAS